MLKTIAIDQIPNLNPYDTLNVSKVTAKTFYKITKEFYFNQMLFFWKNKCQFPQRISSSTTVIKLLGEVESFWTFNSNIGV